MAANGINDAPNAAALQARVHDAVAGQRIEPAFAAGPNSQPHGQIFDTDPGRDASNANAVNTWLAYRYQYYLWMQAQFHNHLMRSLAGTQPWINPTNSMSVPPAFCLFPAVQEQQTPNSVGLNGQPIPAPAPTTSVAAAAVQSPIPPRADGAAVAAVDGNNNPRPAAAAANNNENGPQVLNVQGNPDANAEWDGDIFDILFTAVKAVTIIMLLAYSPSAMRFATVVGAFLVLRALRRRWNIRRAPANAAVPAAPLAQPPAAGRPAPAVAAGAAANNNQHFHVLVDEGDNEDFDEDDDASSDSGDEANERPPRPIQQLPPPNPTATVENAAAAAAPAAPQSLMARARIAGDRSLQFVVGFVQSFLPEAPN